MSSNTRSSFNTQATNVAAIEVATNQVINWDFLDDVEEESETELFWDASYADATRPPSDECMCAGCTLDEDDFNPQREPSYAEAARTPSPVDYERNPSPARPSHGYDCWCNECIKADEDEENNRLWGDIDPSDPDNAKDDPDFSKDDRGGINYHSRRHDKREFRAKERTKDAKKQSSFKKHFKKHFKKRGARNPRTNVRHETRNSKRKHRDVSSDEDENSFEMLDELETTTAHLEPHANSASENSASENSASENYDADLPEKDDRYHRKNRHTKREKHIRDQEKMARELGIPVARKMKRRDIPTSRYNRHKEHIDREEF